MKPVWLIALLLMNVLWAAAYSCFKLLAPVMDAGTLATLRFGFSGVVVVSVWRWIPGSMPVGKDLLRAGFMGVLVFCCAPRLQVAGVQMGRAGDAGILMAFDPVIASVAAAVFLREPVPARRWVGFALGLLGVAMLAEFWHPGFKWPVLTANALILASFVCEAVYSLIGKPLIRKAHPVKVMAVALVAGSMVNLLLSGSNAVRVLPGLGPKEWLNLAYLVFICTVVGYALWFYAVRDAAISVVASTVFAQPVAGVVFALLLLRELPRWSQLGGAVFIIAGLVVNLWWTPGPPSAEKR